LSPVSIAIESGRPWLLRHGYRLVNEKAMAMSAAMGEARDGFLHRCPESSHDGVERRCHARDVDLGGWYAAGVFE